MNSKLNKSLVFRIINVETQGCRGKSKKSHFRETQRKRSSLELKPIPLFIQVCVSGAGGFRDLQTKSRVQLYVLSNASLQLEKYWGA